MTPSERNEVGKNTYQLSQIVRTPIPHSGKPRVWFVYKTEGTKGIIKGYKQVLVYSYSTINNTQGICKGFYKYTDIRERRLKRTSQQSNSKKDWIRYRWYWKKRIRRKLRHLYRSRKSKNRKCGRLQNGKMRSEWIVNKQEIQSKIYI